MEKHEIKDMETYKNELKKVRQQEIQQIDEILQIGAEFEKIVNAINHIAKMDTTAFFETMKEFKEMKNEIETELKEIKNEN